MPIVSIDSHETCHETLPAPSPACGPAASVDARSRLSASLEALLYPVLLLCFLTMAGGFLGQLAPQESSGGAPSLCQSCPRGGAAAHGRACG